MDYKTLSDFLFPFGLIPIMELGEGGFGKAWMVQAKIGGNITAFKTISIGEFKQKTRPCIKSEQDMQKILREVTVCQKLKANPHIVHVYNCYIVGPLKAIYEPMLNQFDNDDREDHLNYNNAQDLFKFDTSGNPVVSPEDQNTFLVIQMEYCDTDLAQWIKNNPTGSPKRTNETITEIFSQILDGLQYMHDNNVIHRDLKPCNIFITICQTDFKICCKIGDFGLARLVPGENENFSVRIGTSTYRSPEMEGLINIPIDQKTDIFSAAFILLELLYDYKNSGKQSSDFYDIKFDGKFSSLFNSHQFPEHYYLLLKMFNRIPANRPTALECKRLLLSSSIDRKRLLQTIPKSDERGSNVLNSGGNLKKETGSVHKTPRNALTSSYSHAYPVEVNSERRKLDLVFYGVNPLVRNFTGRDEEISRLTRALEGPLKYALVCGLGGIGKTELVKKFAHKQCTENHVTWLNGETPASLSSSIMNLAEELEIPIFTDDNKDKLKVLKHILKQLKNQKWLMIIDNVDEIHEIYEVLIKFTINIGNIFVVVTSQSRSVLGSDAKLLEIDHLLPKDAFELVKNSIQESPIEEIKTLCLTLQHFPLALQQAIAYIIEEQRCSTIGQKYGIQDYLIEYECQKMKVFDRKPGLTNEYRKTILITWNLTIERLRRNNEKECNHAVELLNILSFMNPDQLHTDFLFQVYLYSSTSTVIENAEQSKSCFTAALKTLKSYSVIKAENNYISVHRLVQELIRFNLDENSKTKLLDSIITNLDLETVQKTEVQHILSVWKHIQKQTELLIKHKSATVDIYYRLNELSLYFESLTFAKNNFELLKEKLGEDDHYTLEMESCIATSTMFTGKYEEALKQFQKILPKMQKILGKEHALTLGTANGMALTLDYLERNSEALEIYYQILQVRIKKFGKDHEYTIPTKHNIAVVLNEQGKYADSMQLYQQVLEWETSKLGPNHPSTLITRQNIAVCLFRQSKYEEALIEFENILELRVKYLGEEHEDTLDTKSWLAKTLRELGQEERALKLHNEILPLRISTLGEDHPSTLLTRHNRAACLFRQSKYEEALIEFENVLELKMKYFGGEHADTLNTKAFMADTLAELGQEERALKIHNEILPLRILTLGEDHPNTICTKSQIEFLTQKK